MPPIVTFVIPVRHQDNASDWSALKANLAQTIKSIAAQTNKNWRAVIVANHGADLPNIPEGFEIIRVDFCPNQLHEFNGTNKEEFYDAFRIDKGRRVLMGMLNARASSFFMIVDDDDFVSNEIVEYVSKHSSENGWKITQGYVWGDAGKLLYMHNDFANYCGTSLIIRSDLYNLPLTFADATSHYIKTYLGSHIKIGNILANLGTPLLSLPFRGAIYRIGHSGAHSKSPMILQKFLLNKSVLLHPKQFIKNLLNIRFLTSRVKSEYFGCLE